MQKEIRTNRFVAPTASNVEHFTNEEATSAIMAMKPGKAPGLDNIEVEVVQRAWHIIEPSITSFLNSCLEKGIFPKAWKNGKVIIIRKGGDRDPTDPKSYRPIMLLPVLGKLLEKLITGRLMDIFQRSGKYSEKQFGFRERRSTEDAILKMINIVKESEQKYTLGVFLDVSGAFDNLWWPSIMMELRNINCPANLYYIINHYFSERLATVITNHGTFQKSVNKGCPQGSVLGPHLWNIVFNSSMIGDVQEVAFADDKVMLFTGNSRQNIQEKAQRAIDIMDKWCKSYKMELSSAKTVMIQLKGTLDIKRPPLLSINNQRIKMVKTVKWLGVDFDERLGVTSHVKRIAENSKKIFQVLKRVAKDTWGLKQGTLATIYEGLVVSSMTYACAGWADRMNCHHRRTMISAQRSILLGITKAYRTVSTDAVQVLAGVIPIDILLQEKIACYNLRKRQNVSYGSIQVQSIQIRQGNINSIKRSLRKESIAQWQERWSNSLDGRNTYSFLPNIEERLSIRLALSSQFTQILTGHGKFASYMLKVRLAETNICECNAGTEDIDHVVYDCELHDEARRKLRSNSAFVWPASKLVLMMPKNLGTFREFCNDVFGAK